MLKLKLIGLSITCVTLISPLKWEMDEIVFSDISVLMKPLKHVQEQTLFTIQYANINLVMVITVYSINCCMCTNKKEY